MKNILTIILLIVSLNEVNCHDMSWANVNDVGINYNFEGLNDSRSIGLEVTKTLLILNASVNYDNWVVNNSFESNHEVTGFVGIGLLNLLQAQIGYSNFKDTKLKIKTLIPFGLINLLFTGTNNFRLKDGTKFWNYISLVLNYQRRYGDLGSNNYSIGISYMWFSEGY
jgi:hypothetical protein